MQELLVKQWPRHVTMGPARLTVSHTWKTAASIDLSSLRACTSSCSRVLAMPEPMLKSSWRTCHWQVIVRQHAHSLRQTEGHTHTHTMGHARISQPDET